MASSVRWHFLADYIETCNCDFGCPCNFSGFPTGGRCETLVGFSTRTGRYGNLPLDGVKFILAASWPRAIHEGDGTVCVYVDQQASAEQRGAVTEIAYGRGRLRSFCNFRPDVPLRARSRVCADRDARRREAEPFFSAGSSRGKSDPSR